MDAIRSDLRYALRTLRRHPGFASVAILTLAIGIGANTAIFSVMNTVLLRPLPYEDPEELVVVWGNLVSRDNPKFPLSPPDLRDFQEQIEAFEDVGGIVTFQQPMSGGEGPPEVVDVAGVTPNFLDVLGVEPVRGRGFVPQDAAPPAEAAPGGFAPPGTVLISHGLWQRRFGGSEDVLGTMLEVGGNSAEIVGVLPPDVKVYFGPGSGLLTAPQIWATPRIDIDNWPTRNNVIWWVVGRLTDAGALGAAQAEMDVLAARYRAESSIREGIAYRLDVVPMITELTAGARPTVLALFYAVVFVLLIACANVANLLLVRASNREREIAVRVALGGKRGVIIRQLLTESAVMAVIGGAAGTALAMGSIGLLKGLRPANLPRLEYISLDLTVLGFTLMATFAASLLFGLLPALKASQPDPARALRERGGTSALGRQRVLRNGLVVAETALSVILLIGAGLMIRTFSELQQAPLGFEPNDLLTFRLNLPGGTYDGEAQLLFTERFREELAALPGVTAVSAAFPLSVEDVAFSGRYGTEEALTNENAYGQASYRLVTPGFFETMGTRLVEGRAFSPAEFEQEIPSVVVDTRLAGILWPGEQAAGKRMLIRLRGTEPEWVDVVGVVEQQRTSEITAEPKETVYFTHRFGGAGAMTWVVRSGLAPDVLTSQVRSVLERIDPELPISQIATMESLVGEAMTGTRFALLLIGVFAAAALFLAFVGIYGVLSALVRLRTPEIGVRMALGASRGSILGLVIRQGLLLTGIGLVIGLVGAVWATRLVSSLLFEVAPTDPVVYVSMAVGFVAVAAAASYLPARRATRIDPVTALLQE